MPAAESSPARPYRSTLREEQARETRRRILEAAAAVFAEKGYPGTGLADIASVAGVSLESVKVHGPKRQLLLSAFEIAFAGAEGERSITERPEVADLMAIPDNDAFLDALIGFIAAANARTSSLWSAFVSAASADDHVSRVLQGLLRRRRDDYRASVSFMKQRGMLDPALGDEAGSELADVLSFLMSPEGHQQLVTQSGWTFGRYRDWLRAAVQEMVSNSNG